MSVWKTVAVRGLAAAALALSLFTAPAGAQSNEVKLSRGFGITYLPIYVMQHEQLLEKHLAAAGLKDHKVNYVLIDGAPQVNDALLAGAMDIASNGMPAFVTMWSRTKGTPNAVVGVSGLSGMPLYLNTLNPNIKSLKDFTDKDRIAVTGIRTGLGAVILQMEVAKEFGIENYNKLDGLTVNMLHPDAYQVIQAGKTEVNTHMASPPFAFLELKLPGVHRVTNSVDTLGKIHVMATYASQKYVDANPKVIEAFLAARDEATALIAKDAKRAAGSYIALTKVKTTLDEIAEMVVHPDMNFDATPNGSMQWADFLHKIGTIKHRPADWKEMFVTPMAKRSGS